MYTNLLLKFGVFNFKTDQVALKGGRRHLQRAKRCAEYGGAGKKPHRQNCEKLNIQIWNVCA